MAPDGKQVVRRTTTTKRWVTRTVVVEELAPESAEPLPKAPLPPPKNHEPHEPRRRSEDIRTALSVTAGLELPREERRSTNGPGRRANDHHFVEDEVLEGQAVQLRAYWAKQIGKIHERLEERLKPMVVEFGFERCKVFIDQVREEKGERGPRDTLELLFGLLRGARHRARPDEEDNGGK